jgi:hypothetical protein
LEPVGSGLRLSPAGVPVPIDTVDDEAERKRTATEIARREAEALERQAVAEQLIRHREARRRHELAEMPAHLRRLVQTDAEATA